MARVRGPGRKGIGGNTTVPANAATGGGRRGAAARAAGLAGFPGRRNPLLQAANRDRARGQAAAGIGGKKSSMLGRSKGAKGGAKAGGGDR